MIGNYVLTEEQAEAVPGFYWSGVAESDMPEGITIKERYDERDAPFITCGVIPNAKCNLYLHQVKPLIDKMDLFAKDEGDFQKAKKRLEDVFGFELVGREG